MDLKMSPLNNTSSIRVCRTMRARHLATGGRVRTSEGSCGPFGPSEISPMFLRKEQIRGAQMDLE